MPCVRVQNLFLIPVPIWDAHLPHAFLCKDTGLALTSVSDSFCHLSLPFFLTSFLGEKSPPSSLHINSFCTFQHQGKKQTRCRGAKVFHHQPQIWSTPLAHTRFRKDYDLLSVCTGSTPTQDAKDYFIVILHDELTRAAVIYNGSNSGRLPQGRENTVANLGHFSCGRSQYCCTSKTEVCIFLLCYHLTPHAFCFQCSWLL